MARCGTSRGKTRVGSIAALLALLPLAVAQTERAPQRSVTAVRHWVLAETTRIAIEVSGEFSFRSDSLHNPERVYFDILNARPNFNSRRVYSETLPGPLAQRIRVAETMPGVTRVVIDLSAGTEVSSSTLSNPHRLIVELRRTTEREPEVAKGVGETGAGGRAQGTAAQPQQPPQEKAPKAAPESSKAAGPEIAPTVPAAAATAAAPKKPAAASQSSQRAPEGSPGTADAAIASASPPAPFQRPTPPSDGDKASTTAPKPAQAASASSGKSSEAALASPRTIPAARPAPGPERTAAAEPAPAKRTSLGESSLVRALGLKISRVVIDAGHGGHDQGAEGVHGLLEKDLVLDIALRLGKLVESRLGAEVVYTRSDDTYIGLRERTALANERKADLFLSIHANSTPTATKAAGIETYYLNMTREKDAMDVAARENATSDQSVFELASLVQKIAKQEKAEESKEFANRIQTALYAFEAKNVPSAKNRGVRSAPLVVLIGANMPSVLVEIGFLSNSREESLLKKPDYRQKLADALYRGLSRYADSLSHFQTAAAKDPR